MAIIGTVAIVAVAAMPFTPELISFHEADTFTAATPGVGQTPAKAIRASWIDQEAPVLTRPARSPVAAKVMNHTRRSSVAMAAGAGKTKQQMFVPAKAVSHTAQNVPKLVKTSAPFIGSPIETLLVFHTTQFDESGAPIWRIAVWQITTEGERKTIEETVILDSI